MIKMTRVDHRLIHGQVGFTWTKFLEADCILIASNTLVEDPLRMSAMKMAKPSGVKLVMKTIDDSIKALNSGVTDKYKLFILCESVADMYQLVKEVPTIKEVNLGGMKNGETRKQISKAVHLSETDIAQIKELTNEGIELTVQLVPDEQKVAINKLLN